MRDFDLSKAKDMLLNYMKWREEFRVDTISKVIQTTLTILCKKNYCWCLFVYPG